MKKKLSYKEICRQKEIQKLSMEKINAGLMWYKDYLSRWKKRSKFDIMKESSQTKL